MSDSLEDSCSPSFHYFESIALQIEQDGLMPAAMELREVLNGCFTTSSEYYCELGKVICRILKEHKKRLSLHAVKNLKNANRWLGRAFQGKVNPLPELVTAENLKNFSGFQGFVSMIKAWRPKK